MATIIKHKETGKLYSVWSINDETDPIFPNSYSAVIEGTEAFELNNKPFHSCDEDCFEVVWNLEHLPQSAFEIVKE